MSDESKISLNDFSKKVLQLECTLMWKLTSDYFGFKFNPPVQYVYNPLDYASEVHSNFVHKYCYSPKKILFLGMNPGPWGMMQTGVPFGDVISVRDWLKVDGTIKQPLRQHPQKLVQGFNCKRVEVSGKRFWSLAQHISENDPVRFFKNSFIYNYFPLVLLSTTGKNITPADLKVSEQKAIQGFCDESMIEIIEQLQVEIIIAIGRFAEKRALTALKSSRFSNIQVVYISHPSPRNPQSNKNWLEDTARHLDDCNLTAYFT